MLLTQRIKIGINRDIEDDFMDFSRQSQQARIDNVQFALEKVKEYGRKVRIRDYMPGRVTYCLGDYPEKVIEKIMDIYNKNDIFVAKDFTLLSEI